jgi:hypothetical protein
MRTCEVGSGSKDGGFLESGGMGKVVGPLAALTLCIEE